MNRLRCQSLRITINLDSSFISSYNSYYGYQFFTYSVRPERVEGLTTNGM